MSKKIAILGDFNPAYTSHHALNSSIQHVKRRVDEDIQFDWIGTDVFNPRSAFDDSYCGLWIAPGSPYKDMDNVLRSITYTRENNIPTFGNCGGFQHMVIEFGRNVCGIRNADHEETNPDAENLLIIRLQCSLAGKQEELKIIDTHSILYNSIKKERLIGKYFCSYGVNSIYLDTLKEHGLTFTAESHDGQIRAFELKTHPFFLGTLFQPALSSTENEPNPFIAAFVRKSAGQ